MSDRKYRQRGYQDDDRDRQPRAPRPPGERGGQDGRPRERTPDAPRTPNLMANHEVVRCRACATLVSPPIGADSTCPKCRAALHSCAQCAHFDPGARFQCAEPIAAPIARKDASNTCPLFAPSVRVERQTSSARPENDPRSAFDKLFNF
jgi:hypothetical protein